MELSKIIKEEATWLFNEEVGHVEPKFFDAVYETVTRDFRLGATCMASKMKNVFEILEMTDDPNAKKVIDYLNKFIESESKDIADGVRYLQK